MKRISIPRAELHTHLGGAVDPPILWSLAHYQGIKLPSKDYWDFEDLVTIDENEKNKNIKELHNRFYYWTELIQSSPYAVEMSVKSIIGGGYRKCNLVLQELRFNPMFRNHKGKKDLDHIIMAAVRGMDEAVLEYPKVKAGIILMMDRTLSLRENKIILEKAIKYKNRGVIGIDLAGPQKRDFNIRDYKSLFDKAKNYGLGTTIHTGEEGSLAEMRYIVNEINPDRIGHGLLCVKDKNLMKQIVKNDIVLETCVSSNLRNSKVKNLTEMGKIIKTYLDNNIKFTINTDGPEMYRTNIFKEQELLRKAGILTPRQIKQCNDWAFEASFIPHNTYS